MGNSNSKRDNDNQIHPETHSDSKRNSILSVGSPLSRSTISTQSHLTTEESKEYVPANCPVCFEHYNFTSHSKIQLDCKHNVCQSCFDDICDFKGVCCPLCKQGLVSKKIAKIPKQAKKISPAFQAERAPRIYRYKMKYLLVGENQVGITSLLNRLCHGFHTEEYQKTDCISTKHMRLTEGQNQVYMKFKEAPTGERLSFLLREDSSKYAGIILCFDLTNRSSFECLEKWYSAIRKTKWRKVKTILVGTKSDLIFRRTVTAEDAISWADLKGYEYFETSAKTGLNVDSTVISLIQQTFHTAEKISEPPMYALRKTKKTVWWKRS